MRFKKFTVLFFALSCFITSNAQTFRIGPSVVGNLNIAQDTKAHIGFAIGAKGEVNFSSMGNGWFMDVAVLFNNRNLDSKNYFDSTTRNSYQWKYTTYSLNIPLNVGYKFQVSNKLNLLAAVGPYVDFGLTGKDKLFTTDEQGHESSKKLSSNIYKDKLLNRVNAGMNISVGAEIARHYQINLSYSRSFTNLFKGEGHVKAQDLQLGLTYMF